MYKIMKKKSIKSDFKENFLKLVADDRSDKRFLLTPKFCPLGLSAPDLRLFTFGPRQANLVLIAYASSEGSGEPAHPRSLARTFAARSYKQ